MAKGLSDKVRQVAEREYIRPALNSGGLVEFRVGDIQNVLRNEDFPSAHINQICTSLESDKFWKPLGLKMLNPRGQPRKVDTVFQFVFEIRRGGVERDQYKLGQDPLLELSGILRGAIREGAAAFVRELRRDKDVRKEPVNRSRRKSTNEEDAA